jgi:hypothetical protein
MVYNDCSMYPVPMTTLLKAVTGAGAFPEVESRDGEVEGQVVGLSSCLGNSGLSLVRDVGVRLHNHKENDILEDGARVTVCAGQLVGKVVGWDERYPREHRSDPRNMAENAIGIVSRGLKLDGRLVCPLAVSRPTRVPL